MRFEILILVLSASVPTALAQAPARTMALPSACEANVHLCTVAPTYAAALAADAGTRDLLAAYACQMRPEAIRTMDDLLAAAVARDTVIARVAPVLEAWHSATEHADLSAVFKALFEESDALALRVVQAEGMVTGLAYGGFSPHVLARTASPDLRLALHLRDLEGQTMGGEYPFMSLDAEVDLVVAAERLRADYPASPFLPWSQEVFGQALTTLASLHPARGIETDQWFALPTTNDYWPWAADRAALERFVLEATDSRYHASLAAILADPPESAVAGDLELLVVAREASWEAAHARTLAWLDRGVDVVGPVWLGEGDLAVLYRYFPVGDARLGDAAVRAETHGLAVERVRVSVADLWQ